MVILLELRNGEGSLTSGNEHQEVIDAEKSTRKGIEGIIDEEGCMHEDLLYKCPNCDRYSNTLTCRYCDVVDLDDKWGPLIEVEEKRLKKKTKKEKAEKQYSLGSIKFSILGNIVHKNGEVTVKLKLLGGEYSILFLPNPLGNKIIHQISEKKNGQFLKKRVSQNVFEQILKVLRDISSHQDKYNLKLYK